MCVEKKLIFFFVLKRKTDANCHVAGEWKGNCWTIEEIGNDYRGQWTDNFSAKKGAPKYNVQM